VRYYEHGLIAMYKEGRDLCSGVFDKIQASYFIARKTGDMQNFTAD